MDQRVQIDDDNLDRNGTDCWGQCVQYDLKIDWDNVFWIVTDCRRQCVQYDLQIDWDIILTSKPLYSLRNLQPIEAQFEFSVPKWKITW